MENTLFLWSACTPPHTRAPGNIQVRWRCSTSLAHTSSLARRGEWPQQPEPHQHGRGRGVRDRYDHGRGRDRDQRHQSQGWVQQG